MNALRSRFSAAGLDWIVPEWTAPERVAAFVTTRNGGGDAGLDAGPARVHALAAAARAVVEGHRRRIHAYLPAAPVYLEQVHGAGVVCIDDRSAAAARAQPPVADALVTRAPNLPLAVRVADCLPVLLASSDGAVVAAAHAGWRGLAAGVLEATVAAMAVAPDSLVAWLGPAIGPRAFAVGDEVRAAFVATDPRATAHFHPDRERKWLADLPALATQRLATCGVLRVFASGHCTYSDPARFHSWRRERTPARHAAYVWRTA